MAAAVADDDGITVWTRETYQKLREQTFYALPSGRAAPLPQDAFSVGFFFFCLHSAYVGVTLIVAS